MSGTSEPLRAIVRGAFGGGTRFRIVRCTSATASIPSRPKAMSGLNPSSNLRTASRIKRMYRCCFEITVDRRNERSGIRAVPNSLAAAYWTRSLPLSPRIPTRTATVRFFPRNDISALKPRSVSFTVIVLRATSAPRRDDAGRHSAPRVAQVEVPGAVPGREVVRVGTAHRPGPTRRAVRPAQVAIRLRRDVPDLVGPTAPGHQARRPLDAVRSPVDHRFGVHRAESGSAMPLRRELEVHRHRPVDHGSMTGDQRAVQLEARHAAINS